MWNYVCWCMYHIFNVSSVSQHCKLTMHNCFLEKQFNYDKFLCHIITSNCQNLWYWMFISNLFFLDTQCVTLVLTDGIKMSCDSKYTNGVGYVGDTCSFTCNTGYEFSGSDSRTCQNDGSWTGIKATCVRGVW